MSHKQITSYNCNEQRKWKNETLKYHHEFITTPELYCTFEITNEHCRRFICKGEYKDGIYCDLLHCRHNYDNGEVIDAQECLYIVNQSDVM